ncbi:MAG: cobalt ECF transporter T component CbiQ [Elainella sp. Prado103]|jgi:cobalt/nickel transport system permease protein|nr:cobalt ECF transporter T component CbiQ [Elainella sp. Prado103]
MHHHLEVYAQTQRLKIAPQQKLIFAGILLLLALIVDPIVQGMIFVWLGIWTIGYAGIPLRVYGSVLAIVLLFLWISLPILMVEIVPLHQLVAIQTDVWAGIPLGNWYLFVSHSGLTEAVIVALRSLSSTACLLFILFTIPFSELLWVLRQWRLPIVLLDLLLLMYRFIFLFLDVSLQLQLAQRARGGYRTRQRWMQSISLLVGQLVVRSLQRYQQLSQGLAARGFNGNFTVYPIHTNPYSKRHALESFFGCLFLILFNTWL